MNILAGGNGINHLKWVSFFTSKLDTSISEYFLDIDGVIEGTFITSLGKTNERVS